MDTYATLEQDQSTNDWFARILEPEKEPYIFVPDPHAYIVTKGDLVRAVNARYPGVTHVSEALFNKKVAEQL